MCDVLSCQRLSLARVRQASCCIAQFVLICPSTPLLVRYTCHIHWHWRLGLIDCPILLDLTSATADTSVPAAHRAGNSCSALNRLALCSQYPRIAPPRPPRSAAVSCPWVGLRLIELKWRWWPIEQLVCTARHECIARFVHRTAHAAQSLRARRGRARCPAAARRVWFQIRRCLQRRTDNYLVRSACVHRAERTALVYRGNALCAVAECLGLRLRLACRSSCSCVSGEPAPTQYEAIVLTFIFCPVDALVEYVCEAESGG